MHRDKTNNNNSIFSEYEIIDWYDGAISGIGKLSNTNEYYLFNIVAYDFKIEQRVFILIKLDMEWHGKLLSGLNSKKLKSVIKEFYLHYYGEAYIIKASDINDNQFFFKELKAYKPRRFNNIQNIADQNKKDLKTWFEYFENPH